MYKIQDKKKEIEDKIDGWKNEGRIVDVSKKYLPNDVVGIIRIQHSGQPFSVYFDGHACRVGSDSSGESSLEFLWKEDDVVNKVLNHIEKLLIVKKMQ